MRDELPSLGPRHRETHAKHHVVEAGLELAQQVFTRVALQRRSLDVILVEQSWLTSLVLMVVVQFL